MLVLGQDEKAKYPFLADAGEYLKDKGFSLVQFGSDPVLKLSVEKALHRIKVAAAGEVYKSDLIDGQASKDYVLEREVFSFLLAIVLIKLTGMSTLIKRFALAEARRAENYLEKDLGNASNKSKIDLATRIWECLQVVLRHGLVRGQSISLLYQYGNYVDQLNLFYDY